MTVSTQMQNTPGYQTIKAALEGNHVTSYISNIETILSTFNARVTAGVEAAQTFTDPVFGQKTVTTAGTEVALGSSRALLIGVSVIPLPTNTGNIYVGANPVTSSTGAVLQPGHPGLEIKANNLATIYVDSAVNGEGVSFIGG